MPFTFTYKRGEASPVAFKPGSATLTLRSRATDQLDLGGMPAGTLQPGDVVTVTFASAVRFAGPVRRVSAVLGRGSAATQSAAALGPWHDLARLVYRQIWMLLPPDGEEAAPALAARVILHQDASGAPVTLAAQIADILDFAASPCGFAVAASPSVPSLTMPMEEQRDITCAQALERCLRLTPHVCTAFDYSQTPPVLNLITPAASDAAWIAAASLLSRDDSSSGEPVAGVDLEIEATGTLDGAPYRQVVHQSAGDLSDPLRVLTATVLLAGADSDATYRSADITTEDIPSDLYSAAWWKAKHPRLANIAVGDIVITAPSRSGAADADQYPRITSSPVSDIDLIGLKARVERFSCTARITLSSGGAEIDTEENVILTMDFVTTNATTKTYKWMESSGGTSGESMPEGLAAALLAQHASDGRETRISMRLSGSHWPAIGDTCGGLIASEIAIDCRTETADVVFGPPGHLSPEDMADLLTGFRCRVRASHAYSRSTGKPDDDVSAGEDKSVKPMSTTEWAPGTKALTTILSGAKKITLDPAADLGAGEEAKFRTIEWTDAEGAAQSAKILATAAVSIPAGSGVPPGYTKQYRVTQIQWDSTYHKLQIKKGNILVEDDSEDADWTDVFAATPHALEHAE